MLYRYIYNLLKNIYIYIYIQISIFICIDVYIDICIFVIKKYVLYRDNNWIDIKGDIIDIIIYNITKKFTDIDLIRNVHINDI